MFGCHRVESVGHGDDARFERYVVRAQTVRIPRAVKTFAV
jgi:hypothetical protein